MEKNFAIQIIEAALECVLLPLVIWGIKEAAQYFRAKSKSAKLQKYVGIAETIVVNAVKTVSQTYVDALKEQDAFDETAQKTAFNRAMTIVRQQLTDDTAEALEDAFGDVDAYLTAKIEATVKDEKMFN